MELFNGLSRQPRPAIFPDQCDSFFDRIDAMRDCEIDFAGQFASFMKHETATPFDKLGPHFTDEDQRGVIEFANLKELSHE